jgi:hypothetical protein
LSCIAAPSSAEAAAPQPTIVVFNLGPHHNTHRLPYHGGCRHRTLRSYIPVGEAATIAHRNGPPHVVRLSILKGSARTVSPNLEMTTMATKLLPKTNAARAMAD